MWGSLSNCARPRGDPAYRRSWRVTNPPDPEGTPASLPHTTRNKRKTVDGVIVIDKPEGWTSHDVVNKVRHIVNTKKVGHLGTLDPLSLIHISEPTRRT